MPLFCKGSEDAVADEMNNTTGNSDILSQLMSNQQSTDATLKSIDTSLKQILRTTNSMSVSNARDRGYTNNTRSTTSTPFKSNKFSRKGTGDIFDDFTQAFGKSLIDGIIGDDFTKKLADIRDKFASDMGVEFSQIPQALGKQAGTNLLNMFKRTEWGDNLFKGIKTSAQNKADELKQKYISGVTEYMRDKNGGNKPNYVYKGAFSKDALKSQAEAKIENVVEDKTSNAQSSTDVASYAEYIQSIASNVESITKSGITDAVSSFGTEIVGSEGALSGLTSALGGTASAALPLIPLAIAGFKFQTQLNDAIQKTVLKLTGLDEAAEYAKKGINDLIKAANRREESQKKSIKAATDRLEADVKYMVEQPFKILEEAAQAWYDTWDNNLKTITATQGYTKSDVQDLAASFAERLRQEGLTSVISSSDILSNLSKVLESGLSGAAAEEFAYVATILNESIPTQDFFSYASEYASIAANAVSQGKSQSEAIQEATNQLTSFANSLLSASRATGGLTTGLKDAESLFKQSVQISQTAKTYSSSDLGGLLTTVAAVVGGIAPDLATSITDVIYKAAVGGNASDIVALRSLAGINASNTEFLKQLSKNPQKIFATLFSNLAKMQSMSNDAFMEVAEGLSDVFGVSMEALARIDFNQLATAINNYNSGSTSLAENLKLLKSGETTTTAEQLKYQQINQMILDEGLSYVLDSEAGRVVQQHLWQEQQTKAITEATYAVDLQGDALGFLESIVNALDKVLMLMNPIKALNDKVANVITTASEVVGQRADIAKVLELGKVGTGNKTQFMQLTTMNRDYNLVPEYVEMLGGKSTYGIAKDIRNTWYGLTSPTDMTRTYSDITKSGLMSIKSGLRSYIRGESDALFTLLDNTVNESAKSATHRIASQYTWGTISKSSASNLLSNTYSHDTYTVGASTLSSTTSLAQARANDNITRLLNSMDDFVSEEKGSYEDFVKSAKQYGISDFTTALEQAGYSASDVEERFDMLMTQNSAKLLAEREKKEEGFWDNSIELLTKVSDFTGKINDVFEKFLSEWEDYFIKHTVYNAAYSRETVDKIMREERENSESAIYALADALTENDVSLLVDPTIQTNALLSQILKVVNALLNQTSTSNLGGVSLPDTIAGLSLGLINQ